ncbi:lipoprotein insertase outer membrane protein LolB [Pantoea sp. 18069]|uniref:lipoprotein insertase outer membrane protein LolB n=1 Tax=Pantoea sp. 18069 TaxID=2681415 RepID=UPI00135C90D2|nr:lipoprotein insertase outer membrane protein LolB [Pantoea sp. 18069]
MKARPRPLPTRRALLLAAAPAVLWLSGCAQPPARPAPADTAAYWSGRLALQLHDTQEQEQSFSASFELEGSERAGQLALLSPFGAVLAELQWSPAGAQLRQGGQLRESPSLDALVRDTVGTALPIGSLFSWLAGEPAAAPGWQADLTQLAQGRLRAERTDPLPRATLRLVLER